LDLNTVVLDIEKMLRRVIGEDIEFTTKLASNLGRVKADQGQIEQVLMNLAANARDAMPQGGHFRIETSDVRIAKETEDDSGSRKQEALPAGRYVLVTITDDGLGIPPKHLPHIFEPFYTTKPAGKGTGLGLATVYGIVKQNKGFIWASSERRMGTVFKIYLPCLGRRDHSSAVAELKNEAVTRGSETILVVEDEQAVRRATTEFLTQQGYQVLEAKDGIDALSVSRKHLAPIHLLFTDVVMPNMSGGQLAKEMAQLRPETKLLFVSGYAGKTVLDHKVLDVETNFLQKPYSLKQLSLKIRYALTHGPIPAESRPGH